jgi:hypothetical protein
VGWPRPRFTVRRLMVAIAILALVFGAISWVSEMRARSADFRRRAFGFEMSTRRAGSLAQAPDGRWVQAFDDENDLLDDAWAWRMAAKYHRLSYYPWLAAEPDPPPPQYLAHPRRALDMPARDGSASRSVRGLRPPCWTFLWTWRGQESRPW